MFKQFRLYDKLIIITFFIIFIIRPLYYLRGITVRFFMRVFVFYLKNPRDFYFFKYQKKNLKRLEKYSELTRLQLGIKKIKGLPLGLFKNKELKFQREYTAMLVTFLKNSWYYGHRVVNVCQYMCYNFMPLCYDFYNFKIHLCLHKWIL